MNILQVSLNILPIIIVNKCINLVKTIYINFYILAKFTMEHERPNISTFLLTIGLIGGTIIITLAYVSWRKYKGELKEKRKKHNSKH